MRNNDFGRRYFSKAPRRSFYFWINSVFLVIVITLAILVATNFYRRLNIDALVWTGLAVAAAPVLWFRAWQAHSRLNRVIAKRVQSTLDDARSLDVVLTEAASFQSLAVSVALLMLLSALLALGKALASSA